MDIEDIICMVTNRSESIKDKITKKAEECHNTIIASGDSIEEIMVIFNILKVSMKTYIDDQIDRKANEVNVYKDMFKEIFN